MSVNLLLIHPNDTKEIYGDTIKYVAYEPPYWCAVAAQYVLDRGYTVKIVDAEAENYSYTAVADIAKEMKPDLVGIYVTGTNLSASTQKMQGACKTVDVLKEKIPNLPIYVWGGHPSALPRKTLEECKADYVVKGEGYDTIYRLVKIYSDGTGIEKITELPGLVYRENGEIKYSGNSVLLETKEIPTPAWDLLPMGKYMPHNWHIMGEDNPQDAKGRYGIISTSIGCPFSCSYCSISALWGEKKVRFWEPQRVVDEIERLVNEYHVKYIKILDENFVLNAEYVNELCDLIIRKDFDLNMWAYSRVDTVTPELLRKIRKANIRWLAYGIESGVDETLSDVNKGQYNREKTIDVMKWTKEADINIIANFMFGLPTDTLSSMEETFQLSREINPEWINYYVTMPYPGSVDYYDAVEKGKITADKWIQYAQYSYECLPIGNENLSPKDILAFRDNAFIRFFDNNDNYFQNIQTKFGNQYVQKIKMMSKQKLRRKILEEQGN